MQFIAWVERGVVVPAIASKGLHMVSAVHPQAPPMTTSLSRASKGLHMVSAVHPILATGLQHVEMLQRGCTWLVQFIPTKPN